MSTIILITALITLHPKMINVITSNHEGEGVDNIYIIKLHMDDNYLISDNNSIILILVN